MSTFNHSEVPNTQTHLIHNLINAYKKEQLPTIYLFIYFYFVSGL